MLVNNAGVLTGGELMSQSESQIRAMVDVNVTGLTMVSYAAHPLLTATKGAMVINLCSASSIHGIPLLAVYSATKFYVDGFTQPLNIEWEDDDIYVTCIKPPVIDTAMGRSLDPRHIKDMMWEMKPDDVASAVYGLTRRRELHHVLGSSTRRWHRLSRLFGMGVSRWLTRRLTG